MKDKDIIDPEIQYWASLCESSSTENDIDDEVYESINKPFIYDIHEGNPDITTVGRLKKVLENFSDSDRLQFSSATLPELEIQAIWNSEHEYDETGIDDYKNTCYIRLG